MSRNHSTIAHEINNLMREIEGKSNEEIEAIHGIKILETNQVIDLLYNLKFDNIVEWIKFSVEQDHTESFEHVETGHQFDDY